jgi:hypothetical protein
MISEGGNFRRRWLEWIIFVFFVVIALGAVIAQLTLPALTVEKYLAVINAVLSIGTSGVVAFIFYYVVSEGLERRKREFIRQSVLRTYCDAKRNIALAIIHASQKGGRDELSADTETIDRVLTVAGFKDLFKDGRKANEGFYAFQNQMSDDTPEYSEIVFNLKIMGRAFDRLLDTGHVDDARSYDFFVRLDALLRRIEYKGGRL